MKTLDEARKKFWDALKEGDEIVCPCCERHAKSRRRTVYKAMGLILIGLYKHRPAWVHVGNHLGYKGGDFAKMRYWGLIEERKDVEIDNGSNSSGLWRITQQGLNFVEGRVVLYKYIDVYNSKPLRVHGEARSFSDVMGENFDFNEMMRED